ncbi:unnamed protein product, partial [Ectocarpus sp. 12 AP-2014]
VSGGERDQPPRHDRRRRLSGLSRDFDHLLNKARKTGLIRLRAGEKRPREGRGRCKEEASEKAIEAAPRLRSIEARRKTSGRWKLRPPSPRSSPSRRRRTAATIVYRRTSLSSRHA